jgi:predicted nucleic acid-binding protein
MTPSPVLGEYLAGFPAEEHQKHIDIITQLFFVPSLDVRAAAIAARLQQKVSGQQRPTDQTKQKLKVDAQILGIAIANNAEKVITQNIKHFRAMAAGEIEVTEIPIIGKQQELFVDATGGNPSDDSGQSEPGK